MCLMCEDNGGEFIYCPDCGLPICFDGDPDGDYPALAGATEAGDVYCMYHCNLHEPLDDDD